MRFFVLQTVRVPGGKTQYVARGIVADVPEKTTAAIVRSILDRQGLTPTEAGIPWANHVLRPADKVEGVNEATAQAWTWGELNSQTATFRQLNVRIPRRLYAECEAAAAAAGLKLRPWVEQALTAALSQ